MLQTTAYQSLTSTPCISPSALPLQHNRQPQNANHPRQPQPQHRRLCGSRHGCRRTRRIPSSSRATPTRRPSPRGPGITRRHCRHRRTHHRITRRTTPVGPGCRIQARNPARIRRDGAIIAIRMQITLDTGRQAFEPTGRRAGCESALPAGGERGVVQDLGEEAGGSGGLEDGEDRGGGELGGELVGNRSDGEEEGGVGGKGGDAGLGGAVGRMGVSCGLGRRGSERAYSWRSSETPAWRFSCSSGVAMAYAARARTRGERIVRVRAVIRRGGLSKRNEDVLEEGNYCYRLKVMEEGIG